jgi:hypothetical protein
MPGFTSYSLLRKISLTKLFSHYDSFKPCRGCPQDVNFRKVSVNGILPFRDNKYPSPGSSEFPLKNENDWRSFV